MSAHQKSLKTELRVTMETIVLWAWLPVETNTINSEAGGEMYLYGGEWSHKTLLWHRCTAVNQARPIRVFIPPRLLQ